MVVEGACEVLTMTLRLGREIVEGLGLARPQQVFLVEALNQDVEGL